MLRSQQLMQIQQIAVIPLLLLRFSTRIFTVCYASAPATAMIGDIMFLGCLYVI